MESIADRKTRAAALIAIARQAGMAVYADDFGRGEFLFSSTDTLERLIEAVRRTPHPGTPDPRDEALREVKKELHLILGVCDGKDCPGLDRPTEFALAQSRGMRIGTIRRMARKARAAIARIDGLGETK